MKCSRCGNDAVIVQGYAGVALCPRHAVMDIEAKAKREVRKTGGIASGEKLFVPAPVDAESYALSALLSVILTGRRDVSLVADQESSTAEAVADTLEDTAENVLYQVYSGTAAELLTTPAKKIIRPLSVIPREEVYFYARYYGWTGACTTGETDSFSADIGSFLTAFSAGHPSAAYALKRISDQLPEIYQERL